MKEYFNCFIGVPLNPEFKYEFEQLQKKLHSYMPNASIIEPREAHLTLYYLGRQKSTNLNDVADIIYEEKDVIQNEELQIGDEGIFYSKRNLEDIPYIIYLKVLHTTRLTDLETHFASHLDVYNKDDERTYVPHITVAHLKTDESLTQYNNHSQEIKNLLSEIKWNFKMREIIIYGKPSLDNPKFPDVLFRVSII